ncbi:lipocalin family protein [Maribacter sp. ACAM166]|uniref:lipocalin family protein n=1 Tax=Maribacter sp. ACAM166 TaxID=2508996 RepID=UPI0010FD33B0|nr:lipocalin family protein [Maribacter sp. ACAM166]TLP82302.1 hypothetical protein ES765_02390 [Maribacter sp. ACAM166]
MYKNFSALLALIMVLFSCSSDKNDAIVEQEVALNAIIGTWDATELVIDNNTASDDAKFGKQILDFLTNKDCYIVTLQFNEDLTATASNSANYVEINATSTGLDIPCPTQTDEESSIYTFDGSIISIVDTNGDTVLVDVSIDGAIMMVDAADLEIPDFTDSGQLIFVKR